MSEIRVDYEKTRAQARRLLSLSEDCAAMQRRLRHIMQEVPHYWEGGAADSFLLALQKRISEAERTESELRGIAQHMKRTADEFEAAESRIENLVNGAQAGFR